MRLDSALALRAEALVVLRKEAMELQGWPWPYGAGPTRPDDVAIGISPQSVQDFHIAIRIQGDRPVGGFVERLTEQARGEVDLRRIGNIHSYQATIGQQGGWQRSPVAPLQIGCSVGHINGSGGTLGCFVRLTNDRTETPHILSSGHVFSWQGHASKGDDVTQPCVLDQPPAISPRIVASVVDLAYPDITRMDNVVDAAVAEVRSGNMIDPGALWPNDRLAGLGDPLTSLSQDVFKIGRLTDRTNGKISAIALSNVKVWFSGTPYMFDNQLEATSVSGAFATDGDSGSLVITDQFEAIGLLMAGTQIGGMFGTGLAYANPLPDVLSRFNASLIV